MVRIPLTAVCTTAFILIISMTTHAQESDCYRVFRLQAERGGKEGITLKLQRKLDQKYYGIKVRDLLSYGGIGMFGGAAVGAINALTEPAAPARRQEWSNMSDILLYASEGEDDGYWKRFRRDVFDDVKKDFPGLKVQDFDEPLASAVRELDNPADNRVCVIKTKRKKSDDGTETNEPVVKYDKNDKEHRNPRFTFKLISFDKFKAETEEIVRKKLADGHSDPSIAAENPAVIPENMRGFTEAGAGSPADRETKTEYLKRNHLPPFDPGKSADDAGVRGADNAGEH